MKRLTKLPRRAATLPTILLLAACAHEVAPAVPAQPARVVGTPLVVRETVFVRTLDAAGVAEPLRQATVGTKLMGTVTSVLVQEGDRVAAGAMLVRLDARELEARASQVAAGLSDAQAQRGDAVKQAARIRGLYADSAATRAQLDAAQVALSRAEAGVRAAQAAARELDAVRSYAVVRAPFAGVVTARLVDPGAMAAPGAPLVTVQDVSTLRISVSASGAEARAVTRGQVLDATIDGVAVRATVEGVVPAGVGSLLTINALVPNAAGALAAGSSAALRLPAHQQRGVLVPAAAILREGDLTGMTIRTPHGDERRWVRIGATFGGRVEVTAGLAAGETIVVPAAQGT